MVKKKEEKFNKGKIVIYKPKGKDVELKIKLENETVWLTQAQIAELFDIERSVITKHLNNIFKSKELNRNSVCAKIAHTASDGKVYKTQFYNLDVIISVGYRVNSQRATQFRIWATSVLKKYLTKGYIVNQKQLLEAKEKFNQLKETVGFLQKKSKKELLKGQEGELLSLLADYSKTLTLLERYDKNNLKRGKGTKSKFILEYEVCLDIISELKGNLAAKKEASDLFGNENNNKLESVVKNLYQTFAKKELYKNIEEKSANLLYLIIKDHPFTDGNKRIASFLLVYFLDKNNYLYKESGEKKINDNALTALALLIAESNPKEKDQMIALITQLIK
ncbi:type II toxin-antitoxin system death-on-curing family toxin [Patescibacteria group bacterium]|nr:type II toxin-antitoxin system death-on-curing family toxin [Patescibacteria group bacterium]